jgi:hypothetical protein
MPNSGLMGRKDRNIIGLNFNKLAKFSYVIYCWEKEFWAWIWEECNKLPKFVCNLLLILGKILHSPVYLDELFAIS